MPIHYKSIATNYLKLLYSKETVWYLILICCVCAGYIIYITNLSLIFVDYMGVDADHYTYYQGSVLLIYAIMSYFSGRIIQFLGINIARITGLSINLVGGGTLFAVALLFTENPLLITIAMCVYAAGFALCSGIIFSDFMHAFSEIKGLASAMCNFARLLFMALMIGLSGVLFNGTIIPVASMIAVFCLISLVCILFMPRIQPASETAEPAQSVNEV